MPASRPWSTRCHQKAKFILVILDNSTVAMTGGPAGPNLPTLSDGSRQSPSIWKGWCGPAGGFLEVVDPYDVGKMIDILKKAGVFIQEEKNNVAVIIARHPCMVYGRHLFAGKAGGAA